MNGGRCFPACGSCWVFNKPIFRVKFADVDSMVEHLGRQAVRTSNSPHCFLSLSHTSTAVEYNAPVSVDAGESSVLSEARRELWHLKRHAKQHHGDQSRYAT